MALDAAARRALGPWLDRLAGVAQRAGLRPVQFTLLGLLLGLAAAIAAGLAAWWPAAGLWLLSRVPDGVDGALARLEQEPSDLGGFLDVMADFAAYGAFVVGVAVAVPDARIACVTLLFAYYLNGSAFLAISGLAEKRRTRVVAGERSLQFVTGLTEGTETIAAHTVFALLGAVRTTWVAPAVWVFAAMVLFTVGQRLVFGTRVLRR